MKILGCNTGQHNIVHCQVSKSGSTFEMRWFRLLRYVGGSCGSSANVTTHIHKTVKSQPRFTDLRWWWCRSFSSIDPSVQLILQFNCRDDIRTHVRCTCMWMDPKSLRMQSVSQRRKYCECCSSLFLMSSPAVFHRSPTHHAWWDNSCRRQQKLDSNDKSSTTTMQNQSW